MSTIYDAGTVTVLNGSARVIGKNTNWLKDDIKQNDLLYLGGKIYEILSVEGNSELILTRSYSGENVENSEYNILRIAEQVIASDLAKEIQALVEKYNEREAEFVNELREFSEFVSIWKKTGLYIDADGDLAQDDDALNPSVIIDGKAAKLATRKDIQELVDELKLGQ